MTETKPRNKGCIKPSFIKANNITSHSHPAEFVFPFLPFKKNPHSTKNVEYPSFQLWIKWTNLKATLMEAGEGRTMYSDWKPFTIRELRQHFGLYIFSGLSPSPAIERKFKSQSEDSVQGSDFIYHLFGLNSTRRHRHFKTFLGVQDPAIQTPLLTKYNKWNIRPLLKWMDYIFPLVWMAGLFFAVDEMTVEFKGMHKNKSRITYKNEGDGFQCNTLCDNGFCYQFYFRNDPAPKQYTETGLSPL